jgi:hypothetical protein
MLTCYEYSKKLYFARLKQKYYKLFKIFISPLRPTNLNKNKYHIKEIISKKYS